MRRRALLTAIGTTLTATAGCLSDGATTDGGDPATDADSDTDEPTTSQPNTDTRSSTDTTTPDETGTEESSIERPVPTPASDAFADFDCPSFEETDRTVCYHATDVDTAPVVLTAEPEVFGSDDSDDTAEMIEFVLYNRSGASVGFNPYDWGIERYDDGEWTHVAPEITPEPWTNLPSGETFTWAIPTGSQPPSDDRQRQPVDVALDPGIYAFHVNVQAAGSETTADETATGETATSERPSERVELIALFEVETAIESSSGETATDDGTVSTDTATGS